MGCLPWWATIEWRTRKRVMLLLCAFEFAPCIAALTIFGIASPNTYRTALWQEGSLHGWNSNPIDLVYAAANYKPIQAPLPWRQFTTDWNIVISVLSTFILLVKIVMYLTHVFPPILSGLLHTALVIIWSYSVSLQAASDYVDPDHTAKVPWMLTRGCGAPVDPALRGYCQQAVGGFAISCLQVVLYLVFLIFSIISAFPSEAQKQEQLEKQQEENEWKDLENYQSGDFEQELDQMHLPPGTPSFPAYPLSPSKSAFGVHAVESPEAQGPAPMVSEGRLSLSSNGTGQMARPNRDLPLRHHITSDVYA